MSREYRTVDEMTSSPPTMSIVPGTTPNRTAEASVETVGDELEPWIKENGRGSDPRTMAMLVAKPFATLSASRTTCARRQRQRCAKH